MNRRMCSCWVALAVLLLVQGVTAADGPVVPVLIEPKTATPATPVLPTTEDRADSLVKKMTLDEKLTYIGGADAFNIAPIPRLNLPEINMADGPMGVRGGAGATGNKPSTSYGAGVALAATWDVELARKMGASMGRDCRARDFQILLAPGVNIDRSPLCGRNYEYLGEDPFLASQTAVAFIQGLKSEGVDACVKHFAANNQEWNRNYISSEVDERTLHELYLPAFEAAVKQAHVGCVMSAYNLLNGTYCSHNDWLLNQTLKKQWGFQGFVMSDWGAVHDTKGAALGGCDLEMPSALFMSKQNLMPLIKDGTIPMAVIDDKVRRILTTVIADGFLDHPLKRADIPLDDPQSDAVALQGAESSTVLLKNEGNLLPLDLNKPQTILVVGPNADPAVDCGAGSGHVRAFHSVSVLAGIRAVAPQATILYHPGLQTAPPPQDWLGLGNFVSPAEMDWYADQNTAGKPLGITFSNTIEFNSKMSLPAGFNIDKGSLRWKATIEVHETGTYAFAIESSSKFKLLLDDKPIIEASDHGPLIPRLLTGVATLSADRPYTIILDAYDLAKDAFLTFGYGVGVSPGTYDGVDALTSDAQKADVIIACMGFGQSHDTNSAKCGYAANWPTDQARGMGIVEGEENDRTFSLPAPQVATLKQLSALHKKMVVVVNAGAGIDTQGWLDQVPALIYAWYPGQEGGKAIAEILTGQVDPSAKLPVTFAKRYEDFPSAPFYKVGLNGKTPYSEGLNVGYRGFDAEKIDPLFCFGYGLSYTKFEYSNLQINTDGPDHVVVSYIVKNTGNREGAEISQVYVTPAGGTVSRPPKELKGFTKEQLEPGESRCEEVVLDKRAFSYWDIKSKDWIQDAGHYGILVGASSRDIRLAGEVVRD